MTFGTITEESREKAKATKQAKVDWAKEYIYDNFDTEDENQWKFLGKLYGVRLPAWYIPNSETKYLKRLFKQLGISQEEYLESTGCKSLKEMVGLNPNWNAKAEIGLVLEWWHDRQTQGAL